jgi:hypothetical protein
VTQRLQRAAVIMGLVLASVWLVWSLASRYSPPDPYQDFLEPTQRFLALGLAMDSSGLGRLEAAPAAVGGRWMPVAVRRIVCARSSRAWMQSVVCGTVTAPWSSSAQRPWGRVTSGRS